MGGEKKKWYKIHESQLETRTKLDNWSPWKNIQKNSNIPHWSP